MTLLAAPARVARQNNVAAPHAAARRARHAGTVGLRSLLLPLHVKLLYESRLFYYVKLVFCLYYHVVRLRKHEHLRIWDEQYPNFQMPRMHLSRTEFSPFFTFTCVKERSERGGAETETGVLAVMVKGGLGFRKCFLSGIRCATPLPDSYVAKFSSTHVKIWTRAPGRGPHLYIPTLSLHPLIFTCRSLGRAMAEAQTATFLAGVRA
jgi:hypothetical protein